LVGGLFVVFRLEIALHRLPRHLVGELETPDQTITHQIVVRIDRDRLDGVTQRGIGLPERQQ
jgi:hypothetical protein